MRLPARKSGGKKKPPPAVQNCLAAPTGVGYTFPHERPPASASGFPSPPWRPSWLSWRPSASSSRPRQTSRTGRVLRTAWRLQPAKGRSEGGWLRRPRRAGRLAGMERDRRPMLLFLLGSGFLLLIVAAVGPFVRTRLTELGTPDAPAPLDVADDAPLIVPAPVPAWERASSLEEFLRGRGVAVTVFPLRRPARRLVCVRRRAGPRLCRGHTGDGGVRRLLEGRGSGGGQRPLDAKGHFTERL